MLLQKLLGNSSDRFDDYLYSILNYTSHHLSSNRRVFTFFLSYVLDEKFDCDYLLGKGSFKDILVNHCVENIKHRHGGNMDGYSLITFLNIPKEEKQQIFSELLQIAQEYDHSWDFDNLALLQQANTLIVNPFFNDFFKTQQKILSELSEIKLPKDYKIEGDQLSIFGDQRKNDLNTNLYNFADRRLHQYLRF